MILNLLNQIRFYTLGKNRLDIASLVLVSLVLVTLLFQGCATLKKEECLTADWNLIGYEDGLKGHAPERIGKHRKACAEYGVTPDITAYLGGRDRGLVQYCTPAKGFDRGRKGKNFTPVCSPHPDLESAFRDGFLFGRKIYLLEAQIREKKENIKLMEEELAALEQTIKEKESALGPKCVDSTACQKALNQVQDIGRKVYRLTREIQDEKRAIMALSRRLKKLMAKSPY